MIQLNRLSFSFIQRNFALFLFLILGIFSSGFSQVYNGTVTFNNQTQIDTFPPYTVITGDVKIEDSSITNVDSLYHLTEIQGNLDLSKSNSLVNIDGFSNLTTIGGYLGIITNLNLSPNTTLTNLNGLSNLTHVGGTIAIVRQHALTDISGLSGLNNANEDLFITLNLSLTNLDGLSNIDSVGNQLRIYNNPSLTSLIGLSGLKYVGLGVNIWQNNKLKNLDGLSNLEYCGKTFYVQENESLLNIEALTKLTSVGTEWTNFAVTSLYINKNPKLLSLNGLNNLSKTKASIVISKNQVLQEVDALSKIDSVIGNLNITGNPSLKDLYGVRNIKYIQDELYVFNNYRLNDCCGLYNYLLDSTVILPNLTFLNTPCSRSEIIMNGPCSPKSNLFISGQKFLDVDDDCLKSSQDYPFSYQILEANPGQFLTLTDSLGNFQLTVKDTGNYTITAFSENQPWDPCDPNLIATILEGDSLIELGEIGSKTDSCPYLSMDIEGLWNRRCFPGDIKIKYCNSGITATNQTQLTIALPEYLVALSASHTFTYNSDSLLVFDLGTVSPLECGTIVLQSKVSCDNIEILGLTQCVEGWITSPDLCTPTAPKLVWCFPCHTGQMCEWVE